MRRKSWEAHVLAQAIAQAFGGDQEALPGPGASPSSAGGATKGQRYINGYRVVSPDEFLSIAGGKS